jgi:hypothetical protein
MTTTQPRASVPFRRALFCILSAALFLRCWHLNSFSLWLDEILEVYFVQGPWSFFWEKLRFDAVHPPLDYLVTRAVNGLHPSDWLRKLPSAVWGSLTIGAVAELLRRRLGPAAGLGAAVLLGFAPFHIRYSQELRPYSLGVCLLCVSLLALEVYLEHPSWPRLVGLYLASLATAYTLYLAVVVLGIAAAALLVDEAFSLSAHRRHAARRCLAWSPLFVLALVLAYLPWIPVVVEAASRQPPVEPPKMTWERLGHFLSFFTFASDDGQTLRLRETLFVLLAGVGVVYAVRNRATRFIVVWLLAGCATIETLEHVHPHYYVTRHFLVAGVTLPVLAALPLACLTRIRRWWAVSAFGVAVVLATDLATLGVYYREGRPDWRTLTEYLSARPRAERIFTENPWSQLCVAYYVVGPEFLYRRGHTVPEVLSLDGEAIRLAWSWKPGTTAWLVLAGNPRYEELRTWSAFFPSKLFPRAEDATLRRLDPSLWGRMATSVPKPKPTR